MFKVKDAYVPALGESLRIPAPEGFWTIDDGSFVASILKLEANATDANTDNKTVGIWARSESGLWDDIQSASVQIADFFRGKRVPFSIFETICEAAKKEYEGLSQKFVPVADKMAKSISRGVSNLAVENTSMYIADVKFLPPHATGRDRMCVTMVRKMSYKTGGEESVSFSVVSPPFHIRALFQLFSRG